MIQTYIKEGQIVPMEVTVKVSETERGDKKARRNYLPRISFCRAL